MHPETNILLLLFYVSSRCSLYTKFKYFVFSMISYWLKTYIYSSNNTTILTKKLWFSQFTSFNVGTTIIKPIAIMPIILCSS